MNRLTNTQHKDHAYGWASFRSWDNGGSHGRSKKQTPIVENNGTNSAGHEPSHKILS